MNSKIKLTSVMVAGLLALLGGVLVWRRRRTVEAWLADLGEFLKEPTYLFGGLNTSDDLLDYIQDHRSDISIVFYSVDGSESVAPGKSAIFHNADQPMPLASTMKIVVLAAYAREVVARSLDPEELVSVQDWEQYYLPDTDGGAHLEALENLGFTGDEAARAQVTVELDKVVRAMMRESDNAATDYILNRVGNETVNEVIQDTGLHGQDPIPSILGENLSFSNHEHPTLTDERLEALLALSPDQYHRQTEELARTYVETRWGAVERDSSVSGGSYGNWLRAFRDLTPKGTAGDYARIMAEVVGSVFVSSGVSEIMHRHLEWPMEEPANRGQFQTLGAKGGSLPGVLTWAWYLVPKFGRFAGQPRVVTLFMRGVPLSAWSRLSRTHAQKEFVFRIATDEQFARRVKEEMERPRL